LNPWPERDELHFAFGPQINLPFAKGMGKSCKTLAPTIVSLLFLAPHAEGPDYRLSGEPCSDATESLTYESGRPYLQAE
jgi:hypothetical protein